MLNIEFYDNSASEQHIEIVERKGVGHPDSICDGVAEALAIEIAKAYREKFGAILHFNIDKALLAAGKVEKGFGWGRVIKPMQLYIGDRATFVAEGKRINIDLIVQKTTKNWLAKNLPHINPNEDVLIKSVLQEGSEELTGIFTDKKRVLVANDTSAAVGYYPLSPTERLVLQLEQHLNSKEFKLVNPDTGEDVKIMALRNKDMISLTIAMPLLAKMIKSEKKYFDRKKEVISQIDKFLSQLGYFEKIKLNFNTLDKKGEGLKGVYLSLLGTSAEDADSGEVGRGNKVNGVIAVTRPIGTEAAAGKNPVSHVGKIYNVFSHQLAREIFENTEGLKEVYVFLLSEIGKPIDEPKLVAVKIACEKGGSKKLINSKVKEIVKENLFRINEFCDKLALGLYPVY